MNRNVQSHWFTKSDISVLLDTIHEGDLLEFHRGTYSHWAIFEGWHEIQGKMQPCVIHRAASPDMESGVLVSRAISQKSGMSCSGGNSETVGAVQRDALIEVLGNCKVRINNGRDCDCEPSEVEDILNRAYQKMKEQEPYCVATNNCEHLANWCRYGEERSLQAENVAAGAAIVGSVAVLGTALGIAAYLLSDRSEKEKVNKK